MCFGDAQLLGDLAHGLIFVALCSTDVSHCVQGEVRGIRYLQNSIHSKSLARKACRTLYYCEFFLLLRQKRSSLLQCIAPND